MAPESGPGREGAREEAAKGNNAAGGAAVVVVVGGRPSLSGHRPWDGGGRSHGVRTTEAALPREKSRNLQAFKLEKVQYCYGLTKSQHSADWCGDWFAA